MRLIRKHWRKVCIFGLPAAALTISALVLWAGSEISSPSRRPILDYHREYLNDPASHGLRIDHFIASDNTPCLVCTPAGNPGKRGILIRKQLAERGLRIPAFGNITGTLVLTHGRKGRKEDYLSIAERLCACGFRCVIPDLPAHGDHPGKIATYGIREAGLPTLVIDEASRRFAFDKQPAGLMGMSMGGSVAVHAADLPNATWKALVIISSFDSFPAVIEGQAAGYVGTSLAPSFAHAIAGVYQWKSGVPLESIQPWQPAARLHIPTLIAHGSIDPVIPLAGGRHLFNSLPPAILKKWVTIPGADHNNVLVTDYPIYADIAEWMLTHVTSHDSVIK